MTTPWQVYQGAVRKRGPHPVGRLDPNPFGLYDMAGKRGRVDRPLPPAVPPAPPTQRRGHRLLPCASCAAGSWSSPAQELRVSARQGYDTGLRYDAVGFRCVADPIK